MVAKFILSKDQLVKDSHHGSIREQKVIGFPQEKGPIKPYSNVFYWSHIISDYGCTMTEHPHLRFEIINYVLEGSYEIFDKDLDKWIHLNKGDVAIVHAGKGIRHSEKILPRSEILQVWMDPDFDQYRTINSQLNYWKAESFPVRMHDDRTTRMLGGKEAPLKLDSKNVVIELQEFNAGFHSLICPEDAVLSGYVLEGYVEVEGATLGKNDFFKMDKKKEIKIASLINSKVFVIISPYQLEYQTYSALSMH